MRATIIAATSLLACLGLSGCDNSSNAPAGSELTAVQPCNCQAPDAAAAQASAKPHRAKHRHARHEASYTRDEYDEGEAYSYLPSPERSPGFAQAGSSQSRSYYQGESESGGETGAGQDVWVDGYGRSHYVVAASVSSSPAADDRTRLAPWRGYDAKCDEKK